MNEQNIRKERIIIRVLWNNQITLYQNKSMAFKITERFQTAITGIQSLTGC